MTIEVGTETVEVAARITEDEERTRLYAAQEAAMRQFGEYRQKTTRTVPVIVLERK